MVLLTWRKKLIPRTPTFRGLHAPPEAAAAGLYLGARAHSPLPSDVGN